MFIVLYYNTWCIYVKNEQLFIYLQLISFRRILPLVLKCDSYLCKTIFEFILILNIFYLNII